MLNLVGYDDLGPFVHDPATLDQPMHASWIDVYRKVNSGMLSFASNFVLTTVIKPLNDDLKVWRY